MHIEHIRFDKVFDVQARTFSFTSAGKNRYGVVLPGRIVPYEGATCAVALERPDDWSRVLGWRELGTQEVFVPGHGLTARSAFFEAAGMLLYVILQGGIGFLTPWLLLPLPFVFVWRLMLKRRRNSTLRQVLLAQP
ncbi:hypothetical protein [Herbaspirillum sp. SJZ107]|uniref:hypothetical protein n=1 Tax=Herbaspirillum sp. SJZ107 TaxID=2572881 RepID=UPI00114EECD5|nr:hypothetical protein [Herbaspirillum sp. SJZ107]TQK07603.1 hypothetical protein FBX97_2888 [Herbaspirillum sp. SJZ107]